MDFSRQEYWSGLGRILKKFSLFTFCCVRAFSRWGEQGPLSSWGAQASNGGGSAAGGIILDSRLNPCPLHWLAGPQPLDHQGSLSGRMANAGLKTFPTAPHQEDPRHPLGTLGAYSHQTAPVVPDSCDPMDCIPPGSSVHGIFQTRILEWVAISFSRGIFWTQESNPGLLHCRWSPALQADSLPTELRGEASICGEMTNSSFLKKRFETLELKWVSQPEIGEAENILLFKAGQKSCCVNQGRAKVKIKIVYIPKTETVYSGQFHRTVCLELDNELSLCDSFLIKVGSLFGL